MNGQTEWKTLGFIHIGREAMTTPLASLVIASMQIIRHATLDIM